MDTLKYYSREDIQREIVKAAEGREVGVKYSDKFGKRPNILQFEGDVFELARRGATSFHVSEEHWKDPLKLRPGMSKKELDSLRTGFDLILDVDSKKFEYSRKCAVLIIKALEVHKIKNVGVKFSGNTGLHIGIGFNAFPKNINNIDIRILFPECVKVVAEYLKELIKDKLCEELGRKNPFSVVDIDSVLISSRHMYRCPYSLHEKGGLVSLPLDDVMEFKEEMARPERVEAGESFIKEAKEGEAELLFMQAFDLRKKEEKKVEDIGFVEIKERVAKENFPNCIRSILDGIKEDGRKRALFILINFLRNVGWDMNDIVSLLIKWNQRNYEPLKQGYLQSQINWHRRSKRILPPNCDNDLYYKSLMVCKRDNLCKIIKNPVNYALRKSRFKKSLKRRRRV